ncbi:MAG: hypothetical protein ABI621_13425 [Chloroflexota bacterium]
MNLPLSTLLQPSLAQAATELGETLKVLNHHARYWLLLVHDILTSEF